MAKFRISQKTNSKSYRKWDIVKIRNLSAIGMSFNYNKKITRGAILEFNILLGNTEEPIHCLGVVSRIDESPVNGTTLRKIPLHGIAIHFIQIEDRKKEIINRIVKKIRAHPIWQMRQDRVHYVLTNGSDDMFDVRPFSKRDKKPDLVSG